MKLKNIVRVFAFIVLFTGMFFLCGCDGEKPVLLFNNKPITSDNVYSPVNKFELGETTHFVVFNPDGFSSPYLRIQIIKKQTKTQNWGFDVYRANNFKIDTTKKYYINSIKMSQAGTYIMSVYYLNDLNRPIVRAMFEVK